MKIEEVIKSDKLIIFAGSGLSKKLELPDWKRMVIEVIQKINLDNLNPFIQLLNNRRMQAIDVLEFLKDYKTDIYEYIKENFNISTDKDFTIQSKLLKLSNNKIITTNYDNAFELASNPRIIPSKPTSKFNINEVNKNGNPYILKIHGSCEEPDNCIIFKEDYEKLYGDNHNEAAPQKLKNLFSEYTFLFVGFSFNDPDINTIFSKLDKTFGGFNKHFIITPEPEKFKEFSFLESIVIDDYNKLEQKIDYLLNYKKQTKIIDLNTKTLEIPLEYKLKKIAVLTPNPIDLNIGEEIKNVVNSINNINAEFYLGTLNTKTIEKVEEFDLLIIITKVFKGKLYIEENNTKSNVISVGDLCEYIPNDKIPILLITNEKVDIEILYSIINISSFKNQVINRFLYKAKNNIYEFNDTEILSNSILWPNMNLEKGEALKIFFYGKNIILEIGKKCLTSVVGRVEEQINITSRLLNVISSNKLLNLKSSGGLGKTTLIKKIAYQLYNRGYYREGVNFKSCESVKSYKDFENLLIEGFYWSEIKNFKEHLKENYTNDKIDLLIILDNFETVTNNLSETDLKKAIDLLIFTTDYANIVITSREKISTDDFEDVFTLTPMITDDAVILFEKFYEKSITNSDEIKILREEILEELLSNNPLAIKLVTTSRSPFRHISELKTQLKEHFFESINEEYSNVFKNNADLNIERTKSIYQSINYSYSTLSNREKLAFELLSLFPDGISLNNFQKCFQKRESANHISDTELRKLENKSLVENYNGTLQLQPIIRRFSDFQFEKRKENKEKYCLDAYAFNCHILNLIGLIQEKKSLSQSLIFIQNYKNNLIKVLDYLPFVEITDKGAVTKKEFLLNYLWYLEEYLTNEKISEEFNEKTKNLLPFFSDIEGADILIRVMNLKNSYYIKEFEDSYNHMSKLFPADKINKRIFNSENNIEKLWKGVISHIHSMEGYSLDYINMKIINEDFTNLHNSLYYVGIELLNVKNSNSGFYYFELELRRNSLNVKELEKYINSLYMEQYLEQIQCTYTLSKAKTIDTKTIQKFIVTNPYTKGIKLLMLAFNSNILEEKRDLYESALTNLFHIKYYYIEALYYYCLFLKEIDLETYRLKLREGVELSKKFKFQYLDYLFSNLENPNNETYIFTYDYYGIDGLEGFIGKYNEYRVKLSKEDI